MPDVVTIGDTQVGRDEQTVVRIPIAKLPTGTLIDLPVHVYRAHDDGPVLLLQAGLHGDEVNGVESLRRLVDDGKVHPARGTVLVVPILNLFGFLAFSREVSDGKDVNRSFPGSRTGSLASRVAWTYMHKVFPACDVAVDFHTGGARRFNHPQVRYTAEMDRSAELARVFGARFRFASKLIPKSFRHAAHKLGVPAIVYEGGESLRFDDDAIEVGMDGALRVMHHLGLSDDGPALVDDTLDLVDSTWRRAPRSGLFRTRVHVGEAVVEDQVLGTVTDPYGAYAVDVVSPRDGWVISLNHLPVVTQGDAVARVGWT